MNKNIKIIEGKDYITIEINDKIKGDYPITDLSCKYSGFNKLSDIIIHWSQKPDYISEQLKYKILLPLAVSIEKHFPNEINWFETFLLAEAHLNEGADANFKENGKEIELDEDFDAAVDGVVPYLKEVDNPENRTVIEAYLLKHNLPLYAIESKKS